MLSAMQLAGAQLGLNENQQNAALSEYLANGGQNLDPAVTAWCAAFVNATLEQSGMQGTGALNARSFLDWGQEVSEPQRGDIAVFSRGDPNGWQGHVGFFDGYNDDGSIRVLGGNQSDSVNVASYGADRLLGFRRGEAPNTPTAPTEAAPQRRNALADMQARMQQVNALQAMLPRTQMNDPAMFQNALGRLA